MLALRRRKSETTDVRLATLQEEALAADANLEQVLQTNRQLKYRLEKTGTELPTNDFAALRTAIEQSDARLANATKKAQEIRAELDRIRAAEDLRLTLEIARREYEIVLTSFNNVRQTYLEQQKQFDQLRQALEIGGRKHSELLYQLSIKKSRLQQLGVQV